jgi:D-alanine-D-alanine ligase-like ATP-grasp enzyme
MLGATHEVIAAEAVRPQPALQSPLRAPRHVQTNPRDRPGMTLRAAAERQMEATLIRARLVGTLGARHSIRRWRADRALDLLAPERRAAFSRTMWAEAAESVQATMVELAAQLFQFRRNEAVAHVLGQRTPFADPVSIQLASAKDLAYQVLASADVPIPDRLMLSRDDLGPAFDFLTSGTTPCVVKPARGGGAGQGVTTSIVTAHQLESALKRAGLTSEKLLVEREIAGEHFRFLLLDGELLDVLERGRPRVVGDGASTIEELMFAEYERRLADPTTWKPFPVDLDCLFTLELQGLRPSSVPGPGQTVIAKGATNISGRSECSTFRGEISPSVLATVRTAAAALGVRLAGVDVVTADLSSSLQASGGVVLEVNPIPGLFHHYNVADPAFASRVAVPILEALLTQHAR